MSRRISLLVLIVACTVLFLPASRATSDAQIYSTLSNLFHDYGDSGVGWTGGDSAYSVPLPDGRTAWLFSDTFLGPVNEHQRWTLNMIHNSIVVQSGENLETLFRGTEFGPRSLIQPEPADGVSFYWLGDGTVEGDLLRVFALRFVIAGPVWQQVANDIATFSLPDLSFQSVTSSPAGLPPTTGGAFISYGAAILEQDDFTYIYGVEDLHTEKYLHVARSRPGDLMGAWEYYDGSGWTDHPLTSARLASGISNEFSVVDTAGGVRFVGQHYGIGRDLISLDAPAPEGPFGNRKVLYTTPEGGGNIVTYNAKEHPQLGGQGKIVVSYNVNSWNSNDHYWDIHIYRPRFVEITL